MATPGGEAYAPAERRIGRLTLALGLAAAAVVLLAGPPRWAAAVAIGTLLAWVNHRWLGQALDALARAATAPAAPAGPRPRISRWTYARFFARYALIGLVVYAMFACFDVPVVGMLGGLLALGAAALVEGVYEAFSRP